MFVGLSAEVQYRLVWALSIDSIIMTLQKIALLIGLFFLCFVNFENIVESLFYAPEKTYTIGLLYDSKKTHLRNNISLYESFSIEFLHRSEHKLDFVELLNLEEYNTSIHSLFSRVVPISQIAILPWKLNYSNIEAIVVNVDYAMVNTQYLTKIRMFQFDDTQEVGFTKYQEMEIQGKPMQIFTNNDSIHVSAVSKEAIGLVSIMPNLIFKESSIVTRHRLDRSVDIVAWDESINHLAYILGDSPTIIHTSQKSQQGEINKTLKITYSENAGEIIFHPLKISLLETQNSTDLIVVLLILKKTSIALKYVQFQRVGGGWKDFKTGVLSHDIGVNPKQFLQTCQSLVPAFFFHAQLSTYIIVIRKVYFINVTSASDRHSSLQFPQHYHISKIISFDTEKRLIFMYTSPNLEAMVLMIVLMNEDYSEKLRQELGVFDDCYDITLQVREKEIFLFVASEFEYLDVYNLMEFSNPSILKTSFKKLLATYALYKFSGLRILDNQINLF